MKDRVSSLIFFFLGVGSLFPWNAFITESSFFQDRLHGTQYEEIFESAFGLVYNLSNLFALFALFFIQRLFSERTLIVVPYFGTGLIFLVMSTFTVVQVKSFDQSPGILFFVILVCVAAAGILAAPMIAGVSGLASRFSKTCSSAFFSGQAFGGAVASLTSLVTTLSSDMKPDFCGVEWIETEVNNETSFKKDSAAFWYFTVATLISFACIGCYILIARKEPLAGEQVEDEQVVRDSVMEPLITEVEEEGNVGAQEIESIQETDVLPDAQGWDLPTIRHVVDMIMFPCLAVLFTFTVTLSVFPAVTAATLSTQHCSPSASRFQNDLFVPVLFLLFNAFDFIGRIVQANYQPFSGRQLWFLALARALILPFFYFQKVKDSRLPILLDSDSFPILCSILCGFSNGYVGTASMVHASRMVPAQHRDLASTISVTALTIGLMLGSLLSFATVWLIEG